MASAGLSAENLPALFRAADESSTKGQSLYRFGTAAILLLLLVAGLAGFVSTDGSTDWGGVSAAVAFGCSLLVQAELARRRPERAWYEGRALAESAKSLGWQYSVGGGRYARDSRTEHEIQNAFVGDLKALLDDIREARPIEVPADGMQVTEEMQRLRAQPLDDRRTAYLSARVKEQREWYATKAAWNRNRAKKWLAAILLIQAAGLVAAVVKAAGLLEVTLLGVASGLAASAIAWVQLNDHVQLDEAYSLASHDLSFSEASGAGIDDEEGWARFVVDTEHAISREHSMWRAGRSVRPS